MRVRMADSDRQRIRATSRTVIGQLFNPRRVAVVGAGADPKSMGGRALQVLLDRDFAGEGTQSIQDAPRLRDCHAIRR